MGATIAAPIIFLHERFTHHIFSLPLYEKPKCHASMKPYFLLSVCLLPLSLAGQVHQSTIDLSGPWRCSLGTVNLPSTLDESALPPLNADTMQTGNLTRRHPFVGIMYYERDIVVPKSFVQGGPLTLTLERTRPSTLWIDADSIGSCSRLETPHVYNLTGRLTPGRHTLRLRIDNRDAAVPAAVRGSHMWVDATQTNWNGVLGRMVLESSPRICLSDVQCYPSPDSNCVRIHATLSADRQYRHLRLSLGGVVTLGTSMPELPAGGPYQMDKITDPAVRRLFTVSKNNIRFNGGTCQLAGNTYAMATPANTDTLAFYVDLPRGSSDIDILLRLPTMSPTWSEFHPYVYRCRMSVAAGGKSDIATDYDFTFGLRSFSVKGRQIAINGLPTFLRGKHDGCVWPLTGYAPMDRGPWLYYFAMLRQYGINHVRCHTWTMPEAAFEAADEMGVYLQEELPYWGGYQKADSVTNRFMLDEGLHILSTYGNHPSFMALSLGNELHGDLPTMQQMCNAFRSRDSRHLYITGSNNNLGYAGQVQGDDYFVTCRMGGSADSLYTTDVRSSFSFADEYKGGLLNNTRPKTTADYALPVSRCTVPVVSHEAAQFQSYPCYSEIRKYTGVLRPDNLSTFRSRLAKAGLSDMDDAFHSASVRWAAACYKADMERCLRTPDMGGFQLLDMQDYPGQGTALVGLLDAFLDAKAGITPATFRQSCSPVTVMAAFPTYCYHKGDTLSATITIANYAEFDMLPRALHWQLLRADGKCLTEGASLLDAPHGRLTSSDILRIPLPLPERQYAAALQLRLLYGELENSYPIWVYERPTPQTNTLLARLKTSAAEGFDEKDLHVSLTLSDALQASTKCPRVLFIPRHSDIDTVSVGGLFTPDYWNYSMFRGISQHAHREVSPGTLTLLTNPASPLFESFPTDSCTNWQWWPVLRNSRPLVLDATPASYRPIIQMVDNVERCHKLGILMAMHVGKADILVSTTDLLAISRYPEGAAYAEALHRYVLSPSFRPTAQFTVEQFSRLFTGKNEETTLHGVKNITKY
jgi:hypothetical protein